MFAATAGNNPGQSQGLLLTPGAPGFAPGGLTLQSALPPFVASPPEYKDVWNQSDFTFGSTGMSTMKHDLKTPSVQAWNIGVQRQIMKNTVVEARYLGNRGIERLAHLQPERSEHLRERLPAGVQERAVESRHQPRQRPDGLCESAACPGRWRCRSSTRRSGPAARSRRCPPARGIPTAVSSPTCNRARPAAWPRHCRAHVNYTCRMVGSSFSPCAIARLRRRRAVSDERLPREPVRHRRRAASRGRRLVHAVSRRCSCSSAGATPTGSA